MTLSQARPHPARAFILLKTLPLPLQAGVAAGITKRSADAVLLGIADSSGGANAGGGYSGNAAPERCWQCDLGAVAEAVDVARSCDLAKPTMLHALARAGRQLLGNST